MFNCFPSGIFKCKEEKKRSVSFQLFWGSLEYFCFTYMNITVYMGIYIQVTGELGKYLVGFFVPN